MVTIFDVVNYFLRKVDKTSGSSMTPLKLQKLVYYAQAWHLAFYGTKLFNEEFQAWVHGPVNYELWQKYSGFMEIEPEEGIELPQFTDEQLDVMNQVWEVYGKYDAKYLEELTHKELPWIEARKGYGPGERCNVVISTDTMREYYRGLLADE